MKSKKDTLLEAIAEQNWKSALSIAKSFKYDFNTDEQKILQHGYAFIIGQSVSFFEELKIDMENEFKLSVELLQAYAMKHTKIEPFYVNAKTFKDKVMKRHFKEWGLDKDKTE